MKPIHEYPRGGEGSHNIEFSYNHYPPEVRVFFSREHRKNAREHFRKFAREHFCFARELSKKNLPVNPRKSPWTPKKCPWILKVPVSIFTKIAEFGRSRALFICVHGHFFFTYTEKLPVNCKMYPWPVQNFMPANCGKVPVKMSKKVPVNATTYPWTFGKKCPWTQKCARVDLPKNEVHGHFWGSREKKTLPKVNYSGGTHQNSYLYIFWPLEL